MITLATLAVLSMKSLIAIAASLAVAVGINLATSGPHSGKVRSYTAGAAAMGKGLVVIQGSNDNTAVLSTTANQANALGIVDEANINIGDAIGVVMEGSCTAQIGAAVTAPAYLKSDAEGRLIPATATGDNVIAQALSSNTTANDFVVVQIVKFIHP